MLVHVYSLVFVINQKNDSTTEIFWEMDQHVFIWKAASGAEWEITVTS